MNVRFTAWFSERERQLLDERAQELGTSTNYLVRIAVRQFLGLDKSQMLRVTTETETREPIQR